jgi:hypothetical protein
MKRTWPFLIAGVILAGVGVVWTLQGLNVLGGSIMSGSAMWATIGPVVGIIGLCGIAIAIVNALRGRRTPPEG